MEYIYKRYQLNNYPKVNISNNTLELDVLFFVGIKDDSFSFEAQEEKKFEFDLSLTYFQMHQLIIEYCINFINQKYNESNS